MTDFDLFLNGEKCLLCKDDNEVLFFLNKIYDKVKFNDFYPTPDKCYKAMLKIKRHPVVFTIEGGILSIRGLVLNEIIGVIDNNLHFADNRDDVLIFENIYDDFMKYVTPYNQEMKKVKIIYLGI